MNPQPTLSAADFVMTQLPQSLEEAIAQAQAATRAALAAGYPRLQIELLFPELKPLPVAEQFLPAFAEEYGEGLKVFFSDAGAAALARRDWGPVPYKIGSVDVAGTRQTTAVEDQIEASDRLYVFVAPSSAEVGPVEKICDAVGDRPVILLNARLEDVGAVGIGYAARQLRKRFLDTIEPCYYLRPFEGAALMRAYPSRWLVWLERGDDYELIAEELQKPDAEKLEQILMQATGSQAPRSGFLAQMERFLKALGQ